MKPVRIAVHSAPQSFDPHLQNEILTSAVLANLYDGLTEFDEESRVVAALASEWRNPDERTWVFRLRPGVVFHDGRPLTARDVLFSLERARHHSGSGLASYLVEVETVRSTDAATIEIRTKRPFAALLAKLTAIAIVPASSPAEIVEPVGTRRSSTCVSRRRRRRSATAAFGRRSTSRSTAPPGSPRRTAASASRRASSACPASSVSLPT